MIKIKLKFKEPMYGSPIMAANCESMIHAALIFEAFRPFASTWYIAIDTPDGRKAYMDNEVFGMLYEFEKENPYTLLFINEVKKLSDNDRERILQALEVASPEPTRSDRPTAKTTPADSVQGSIF